MSSRPNKPAMASAHEGHLPTEDQEKLNGPTYSRASPGDPKATVDAASVTTQENQQRSSESSQPSSKKRRPGIQLNKDDHPEGLICDSDKDDDVNDEGGKRSDPFKRASDDVIKKRKIVKASNKWSSGGTGGISGGGTFAAVKLAPTATENSEQDGSSASDKTTSIFGSSVKTTFGSSASAPKSGFGSETTKSGGSDSGFVSVSHGFGALKSSSSEKITFNFPSKSTAFGGGFGATSTGFGSLKSSTTTSGFGSASNAHAISSPNNDTTTSSFIGLAGSFAKSPNQSSNASPSKFPTSALVDTANGEQDEDCLCQVRAKLFKMVPEDETPAAAEDSSALEGDIPSVPSSSGRMELVKAKNEDAEGSPAKAEEPSEKVEESTSAGEVGMKPIMVPKEAGIGPVRVLKLKSPMILGGEEEAAKKPMSSRVVQRQETSGGQATRVILNVRLVPKTCSVIRRGDTYVQLNAPNSDGTLVTSLFKVRTSTEADTLDKNLRAMLDESG